MRIKNRKFTYGEIFLAIIFLALFLLNLLQVIFRYVVGASLSWSEELARMFFVWVTYFGGAYAYRSNDQIVIDVLDVLNGKVSDKILALIDIAAILLTIIITSFFLYLSFSYAYTFIARSGITTAALKIPMAVPVLALPLGCLFTIIFAVVKLIKLVKEVEYK